MALASPGHRAENGPVTAPNANELVGQLLTLADAMLGEVVVDLRKILAYANYPGTVLRAWGRRDHRPGCPAARGRAQTRGCIGQCNARELDQRR